MTIFIKVGNSICVKALNQIHLSQLFSDLEAEKADVLSQLHLFTWPGPYAVLFHSEGRDKAVSGSEKTAR